ncbi:MAG: SDR family oxidoreductase [Deltaproteobacteria bacterium]|nr:SDR family oxidoreductase [Deltaproteobacteria bacterium]MBW2401309.1 SDR family oxidoreductase [Deltaproteobacteria bacterium]
MSKQLEGKVAVITGGASGIGLGIAKRYVAEGARVMLSDLNADALVAAAAELGDSVATQRTDVTQEADVEAMIAATLERFGALDIAVNAAGIGNLAPIDQHPVEMWDQVLAVNLRGTMLALKHELQVMGPAGSGVVINIASINAKVPAKGMSAYCASKAAVDMLTRCAALEIAAKGVRVVGIGPGLVETPLTSPLTGHSGVLESYLQSIPLGRTGAPADVAGLALYLAGPDASWVTGHTFYIDGGEANLSYPDIMGIAAGL